MSNAQEIKPKIYGVELVKNKQVAYKGNLNEGVFLKDLSWAWNSSNACFPATQKSKFTGKHLFYTGVIPSYSEVEIIVIPKNKRANFSVYGYQIPLEKQDLVPNLPRCISCEADHKWDRPKRGKKQNHKRIIKGFTALRNQYRLVIGVTGANGLDEGEFTIVIKTTSR